MRRRDVKTHRSSSLWTSILNIQPLPSIPTLVHVGLQTPPRSSRSLLPSLGDGVHILSHHLDSLYLRFQPLLPTAMKNHIRGTPPTIQAGVLATNVLLAVPTPTALRDIAEQEAPSSHAPITSARPPRNNMHDAIPEVKITGPSRNQSLNPSIASDPSRLQVRDLRKQAQRAQRQRRLQSRQIKQQVETADGVPKETSFCA